MYRDTQETCRAGYDGDLSLICQCYAAQHSDCDVQVKYSYCIFIFVITVELFIQIFLMGQLQFRFNVEKLSEFERQLNEKPVRSICIFEVQYFIARINIVVILINGSRQSETKNGTMKGTPW